MLKRSKEKSSTRDERSGLELASAVVMRPSLELPKTQQNYPRTTIGRQSKTKHSADILLSSSWARCLCSLFHFYLTLLTSSCSPLACDPPISFLAFSWNSILFPVYGRHFGWAWWFLVTFRQNVLLGFACGSSSSTGGWYPWIPEALPNRWSSLPFVNLHWRPARTVQSSHLFLFPALDLWLRKLSYFLMMLSRSICTALNLLLCRGFPVETRRNQPQWWWSHHWPPASFPTVWELPDEPVSNTSLCMGNRDWESSDIFTGRWVIQGPLRWFQKSSCSACKAAYVDCWPCQTWHTADSGLLWAREAIRLVSSASILYQCPALLLFNCGLKLQQLSVNTQLEKLLL